MKNILNKKTILPILGICTTLLFGSCTKWSESDSKAFYYPSIDEQNPELYAHYLNSLKEYKNSDHKYIYAWFDNSEKEPRHRSQHINNVPDSIDFVILSNTDYLADWEIEEIRDIKENKNTQTLFSISLDVLKSDYNTLVEEITEQRELALEEAIKNAENSTSEGEEMNLDMDELQNKINEEFPIIDFESFLLDKLQIAFKAAVRYDYHGICINIIGKSTLHMFPDEKARYIREEQLFMGIIDTWLQRNPDKVVVFEGKPQNLIDKSILENCKHIIIPTHTAANSSKIALDVATASVSGVPTDRFIVTAQVPSMDPNEEKVGKWADGTLAVTSTATWATGVFSYNVAGMGILDINVDYYSKPNIYTLTKGAINILNPSLK